MIIYKLTDSKNGKIYIGQDSHNNPNYYGSGKIIISIMKKYGKEIFKKRFQKEIIEHCTGIDDLNEAEIFWIWYCNSLIPKGYNISKGGYGSLGVDPWNKGKTNIYSQETLQKMSDLKKGSMPWNKGKKGLQIAWNKGIPRSKECKQKISQINKGKNHPFYGKHFSEEHKNNLSRSNKGQIPWNKGKKGLQKLSETTKQKISQSKKGSVPWNKGLTKFNISKEDLYQHYIIENKSQYEIAKNYHCGQMTICKKLKNFNIKK